MYVLPLKGLSKRNTHIPHIVLYDEEKWQKMCSNAYFGVFRGGGHFWRVTPLTLPPVLSHNWPQRDYVVDRARVRGVTRYNQRGDSRVVISSGPSDEYSIWLIPRVFFINTFPVSSSKYFTIITFILNSHGTF